MSHLLDTHVLLWLLADPMRVPELVRTKLADPEVPLLVSAVSALEIATKTRLGKLPDVGLLDAWQRRTDEIRARQLSISTEHCLLAGTMGWAHRDPFDRLLAAQAIIEGATLVTVDRAFGQLTTPTILSW